MSNQPECNDGACACRNVLPRRDFHKILGMAAAGTVMSRLPVMAGPFSGKDFETLVPADKKLDPAWVKSLFARGEPQVYRGAELRTIGMPVGGIGAGQLYLGGDGKLWLWDIFNQDVMTGDAHYAHPVQPSAPLEQGFAVAVNGVTRMLDSRGFSNIRFRGEYPMARVEYSEPAAPVAVTLEAFSPFIPLNPDDSGLPATIMQFTVKNTSAAAIDVVVTGTLENAVCLHNRSLPGVRRNRTTVTTSHTVLECSADRPAVDGPPDRPDVVFEDWNKATYEGWKCEGAAFGAGPIRKFDIGTNQGDVGGDTERVVNSHATAPGTDVAGKDRATGTLTSREFTIQHRWITFWIGGGSRKDLLGFNLLVDGQAVRTATGRDDNKMTLQHFDVADLIGKKAVIQIVDNHKEGWGNIGIGRITFTDRLPDAVPLPILSDYGTMALMLLGKAAERTSQDATVPLNHKLIGELGRRLQLAAGQSAVVTFVITWFFPNLTIKGARGGGRHYATRFESAASVARYVADHFDDLSATTRLWRDTWYDSTLPYWFLDRTFLNTSTLATSTSYRFKDGRFYGSEGVGCCAGTCTSVWYYAQAVARLFPGLERSVREMQDFADGIGFDPATGGVFTRGEFRGDFVLDGQAGNVLRIYREHQMSADGEFLKRNWQKTRQAIEWLITQDGNGDGIIDGLQSTTLDCGLWWGAMSWTSLLYLAALRAGCAMALEMHDPDYANRLTTLVTTGVANLIERLWNGEYFIHKPDRSQSKSFIIGNGCHIDQVYGQAWADQIGLGRILPAKYTRSALQAIWKYNFTPDVGPYRKANPAGRWYAMAGEAGVIMTTWPHGDRETPATMEGGMAIGVGYLNECMSGFEHQVAGHMLGEGLVLEGLAVERVVHDRYHPSRRNPWNEIECGDHYSRAMASYGVFIAACGFEYHGPQGYIAFAPKLTPEKFKAPFTAAEGWGTYQQTCDNSALDAAIMVRYGSLRLRSVSLGLPQDLTPKTATLAAAGTTVPCKLTTKDGRMILSLSDELILRAGQQLQIVITCRG